jgi:hypothetical protein
MFNKLVTDTKEADRIRTVPMVNAAGTVLLKFMFLANRYNIVKGTPNELIAKLGITRWDFTHGVRALKKDDLIRKYTKREYMINPNVLFNGDDKQQYVVQHLWNTQTLRTPGK